MTGARAPVAGPVQNPVNRVLVVNPGSSSLKLSVLEPGPGDVDTTVASHLVERWDGAGDLAPLRVFLDGAGRVDAIGYRVVHGGPRFIAPARLDDEVVQALASYTDLAPLHQPRAVAAMRAVGSLRSDVPAVACFDTAFHAWLPVAARTYALPREWNERFGLRRYGFHGLSHAYATRRAGQLLGRDPTSLRLVTAHLGAGASLAAVVGGRSVDTTMGFTPLSGLVMATRSGSVDPGLVLWLLQHGGLSVDEVSEALEHRSGLAGLTGTSGDMREVLAQRGDGDEAAAVAFDVYVHRMAQQAAGMVVAAGGLDALVVTGGVGEHAVEVRAALARRLALFGLRLDAVANASSPQGEAVDRDIAADDSAVRMLVIQSREDVQIAHETRAVLAEGTQPSPTPAAPSLTAQGET